MPDSCNLSCLVVNEAEPIDTIETIEHTSRASDNTLPPLLGSQVSHFVVSTTKLEGEDGLQVLTFEEDLALQAVGQVDGMC